MTDTSMADGASMDPGDGKGDGTGNGKVVILTVLHDASSGEFTLIEGDEPDEEETGGAPPGAAGAMGGAAPPGARGGGAGPPGAEGTEGEQEAPEGETFDSVPELMKAILEVVQEADQGGNSEDAGMAVGYDEASGPAGAAPPSPVGPNS